MNEDDLPPPLREQKLPAQPIVEELPLEDVPAEPPPPEPPMQAPADPFLRRS